MNFTNTSNNTSYNFIDNEYPGNVVITSKIIQGIFFIGSLYVSLNLTVHWYKKVRLKRIIRSRNVTGGRIYSLTLISSYSCCCFLVWSLCGELLLSAYGMGKHRNCDAFYKTGCTLYAVSIIPVYTMLWLKQRVLYGNPVLAKNYNPVLLFVSKYSILLIVFNVLAAELIYMTFEFELRSNPWGCSGLGREDSVPYVVAISIFSINNILTLLLFIIPLQRSSQYKRQLQNRRRPSIRALEESTGAAIATGACKDEIMAMMKRSMLAAIICFVSDGAGFLSVMFMPKGYPLSVVVMMYDIGLSTNVVCLAFSFKEWKAMLLSDLFYMKKTSKSDTSSSVATSPVGRDLYVAIKTSGSIRTQIVHSVKSEEDSL